MRPPERAAKFNRLLIHWRYIQGRNESPGIEGERMVRMVELTTEADPD